MPSCVRHCACAGQAAGGRAGPGPWSLWSRSQTACYANDAGSAWDFDCGHKSTLKGCKAACTSSVPTVYSLLALTLLLMSILNLEPQQSLPHLLPILSVSGSKKTLVCLPSSNKISNTHSLPNIGSLAQWDCQQTGFFPRFLPAHQRQGELLQRSHSPRVWTATLLLTSCARTPASCIPFWNLFPDL